MVELDEVFCFLDVDFDELLADEFDHLHSKFLILEVSGVVKTILQNLDGSFLFVALVVAFTKS